MAGANRLNVGWETRMAEAAAARFGIIIARRLGCNKV